MVVGLTEHTVGDGKDRHRRAIVLLEHDAGCAGEVLGEVPHVLDGRGTEAIDRLGVIADGGQIGVGPTHSPHDVGLDGIGVLVFVDQDVVEQVAKGIAGRADCERSPEEQHVVIVEHIVGSLLRRVRSEDRLEIVGVISAPRVVVFEYDVELDLGAHHA